MYGHMFYNDTAFTTCLKHHLNSVLLKFGTRLSIHSDREELGESYLYPYWAGSVLGPIVYILAVVHALLWGYPSAIVGSVVSLDIEQQIYYRDACYTLNSSHVTHNIVLFISLTVNNFRQPFCQ